MSADADPSTGYIVYDSVNGLGWNALGGTSGATPLWAAVLAVDASANANTAGYGALNPALYLLAQQSPDTYLNDMTTGNNDYNATEAASTRHGRVRHGDRARHARRVPAGDGAYRHPRRGCVGDPGVRGHADLYRLGQLRRLGERPLRCHSRHQRPHLHHGRPSTTIGPTLPLGTDTLEASSCSGLTLSGVDAGDYAVVYTNAANDFTVNPGPVDVAVSGSQSYGGPPIFAGPTARPPGVTVNTRG